MSAVSGLIMIISSTWQSRQACYVSCDSFDESSALCVMPVGMATALTTNCVLQAYQEALEYDAWGQVRLCSLLCC